MKNFGRLGRKPTCSSNFCVRKFREGGVPRVHDGACRAGPPDLDQATATLACVGTKPHLEPARPAATRRSAWRGFLGWFSVPPRFQVGGGHFAGGTKPRMPPLFEILPPKVPPRAPGMWHTSPDRIARQTGGFHRENKKARKALDLHGLVCGAGGRTRRQPGNPHEC